MDERFDRELRGWMAGAAAAAGSAAGPAPHAVRAATRAARRRAAGRLATAALAVAAVALGAPRLLPEAPADRLSPAGQEPVGVPAASPASPSRTPDAPRSSAPTKPPTRPKQVAAPPKRATAAPSPRPSTAPPPPEPRAACRAPLPAGTTPAGVSVTVGASSPSAQTGESLTLTVTVRNDGAEPVHYSHSGQRFDFWVTDAHGQAWGWSTGEAFADYFGEATLAPGEEITESVTWAVTECRTPGGGSPKRLASGSYTLRGLWVGDAINGRSWWSAPMRIEVA